MNDFDTRLTALLDGTAEQIEPHPDFGAVRTASMSFAPRGRGGRRFPRSIGIAAATVMLLGGGVAAFEAGNGGGEQTVSSASDASVPATIADEPPKTSLPNETDSKPDVKPDVKPDHETDKPSDRPSDKPEDKPSDKPEDDPFADVVRTAELGAAELAQDPMVQKLFGTAAPGELVKVVSKYGSTYAVATAHGEWKVALELNDVPVGSPVPIRVSFSKSAAVFEFVIEREPAVDEPKPDVTVKPAPEPVVTVKPEPEAKPEPEPKPEPAPIAFTSNLGSPYQDDVYMKQGFYGTAPAGSAVSVTSEWGSVHTTAGAKGHWEAQLKLTDVPDGTVVRVRVVSNVSDLDHTYDLVRDRPAPEPKPETKPFTAQLGTSYLDWTPMKQAFHGTATPGSVVRATSEYGSAEAVAGAKGHWELLLKMYEVPGGTTVHVRVTNSASDAVHEFSLKRPKSEPEPDPVDFTANAALAESDADPLVNEYWGTATPGAKITISSDYGGGHVTVGADGSWDARIEFGSVPAGTTFKVKIFSSKSGNYHYFYFTRTA